MDTISLLLCLFQLVTGFHIDSICSSPQQLFMKYENINRTLLLYLPSIFCDPHSFTNYVLANKLVNGIEFDPDKNQLMMPTLMTLHCLGCNYHWELNKYKQYSEQYGFALVVPKGGSIKDKPSWNGDFCCDPALDKDIDDIGFIDILLTKLFEDISILFPYISLSFDALFMTGYSNGAFMVDKIGWNSAAQMFPSIIGISPMAGYIYNPLKYVDFNDKNKERKAIAIYMHHSATDEVVNINGCCNSISCKANIDKRSTECVSVKQEWLNWVKWNGCNVNKYNISFNNLETKFTNAKYSCASATKLKHECNADTILCIHQKTSHGAWAHNFPLTKDVILFFLQTLCESNFGNWISTKNEEQCECLKNKSVGRYCETSMDNIIINWDKIEHIKSNKMKNIMNNDEIDQYSQRNENDINARIKQPNKAMWKDRKVPKNLGDQYNHKSNHQIQKELETIENMNFLKIISGAIIIVGVVVVIILICVGCSMLLNRKKKKYKILPQFDDDAIDNRSDSSNSNSYNTGEFRKRIHH